jgi:hypothetical protein
VKRGGEWEKIFAAYSNCEDSELDGISDFSAEIDEAEAEDEESELGDVPMASESDDSEEIVEECKALLVPGSFISLPKSEKYKVVSFHFGPEVIHGLMDVYQERCRELSKMNLPFWSLTTER